MGNQISHQWDQKPGKTGRCTINTDDTTSFFHKPFANQRITNGYPGKSTPTKRDNDNGGVEMKDGINITKIDEPASHDQATGKNQFSRTDSIQKITHNGSGYPRLKAIKEKAPEITVMLQAISWTTGFTNVLKP